jgi:hypothetical protein
MKHDEERSIPILATFWCPGIKYLGWRWRCVQTKVLDVEEGGRVTDGITEYEGDDEAHSRRESLHGETCVGLMVL